MKYILLTFGIISTLIFMGCTQMEQEEIVYPEVTETATLAGGCFWCMESAYEELDGVIEVISGYTGGKKENPTYKEVSSGTTGHLEGIQVIYDPTIITYKEIIDYFWRNVNPTDAGGQFVDRGEQYATAIFYHNEEQRQIAEQSKKEWDERSIFEGPIVTPIRPFEIFYKAEEYHQDYFKKNPLRYKYYRSASGRDNFIEQTEQKEEQIQDNMPTQEELKDMLTPMQYSVTQEEGTEQPFNNAYWNNTQEGIDVDII
jgi:peptide methionine sulfoxide reductase msrA/msrB